jgi:hypothetical protein
MVQKILRFEVRQQRGGAGEFSSGQDCAVTEIRTRVRLACNINILNLWHYVLHGQRTLSLVMVYQCNRAASRPLVCHLLDGAGVGRP